MRLLLVGPPGSGKGTQASLLARRLNLTHLATGNLLREAVHQKTPAGQKAEPFLTSGKLAPDELVNQMVAERLQRPDRPERFVMDGYPRTRSQAEFFDDLLRPQGLDLQAVIELTVEDENLVRRIIHRRLCSNPNCQTPFHLISRPPKVDNTCDVCGAPLIQRADDTEATVRHRLGVYHQTSEDLLDHYRRQGELHRVNGDQDMQAVLDDILAMLKALDLN
jgi:adenylate kinase